jgi:hypothetical protein
MGLRRRQPTDDWDGVGANQRLPRRGLAVGRDQWDAECLGQNRLALVPRIGVHAGTPIATS